MNQKVISILLGVIQIVIAIWYFDLHSTNQMLVSGALSLSGVSLFLRETDSKRLQRTGGLLLRIGAALAMILFLKVVIFD